MAVGGLGALSRTCCPTVWLWAGQALYAGAALDLAPHSGSVWCLAVGVDGPFTVRVGDGAPLVARSALIPPRTTHQLVADGRMIFCYLDPASDRAAAGRNRMQWRDTIGSGHGEEAELIRLGARLLATEPGEGGDDLACDWLERAAPGSAGAVDPRIAEAAQWIRADPAGSVGAGELAARLYLSESRFLHLFRRELGTSLRRYRVWIRLLHAAALLDTGCDLTTAAIESGFATPSHLAHRFRTTFGLSAGKLLGTGVRLRVSRDQ
ncbi:AraC family transcriptional regulator [Nocardia inohanensis]|uniref:AraC family transcriptional regulator n=1 Tax=Nocardia inohanensis TaxID=209246 RepID=UPI00082F35F1|nr:AraC family transcriptional regulator [Nocardia inohanensis]